MQQKNAYKNLPYDPSSLPRELNKYYISASEDEIEQMLKSATKQRTRESLFSHIHKNDFFSPDHKMIERLSYEQLIEHVEDLANKNRLKPCFIGESLKWYSEAEIVPFVSSIRGLTTAYTPYQPERSQGTLHSLWIYSSLLSQITGFEAINASFYERSTALFEACKTALRLSKNKNTIYISEAIYREDLEVLETLSKHTELKIKTFSIDPQTGSTNVEKLKTILESEADEIAALCYPQINCFGVLEDVDLITDLTKEFNLLSIGLIDPILLADNGLKEPSSWGKEQAGTTMIVGEGQHLAIGPNFGGPGLGIFGIRYNEKDKTSIRATAGRFVGKTKDETGKDCFAMVLSTREQHIRREKATSNICSNQSFLATLAGASLLSRGKTGLAEIINKSRQNLKTFLKSIENLEGVEPAFSEATFFNEICLRTSLKASELIKRAQDAGLHLSTSSSRCLDSTYLVTLFFNDQQTIEEVKLLSQFFQQTFSASKEKKTYNIEPVQSLMRKQETGLTDFSLESIKNYYEKLGQQNLSPDDNIYPLGSCTMKYNPYINDYAATLKGFTQIHPLAPQEDSQGSLEVIYHIQETFKKITGLPGVTTQPVAGAQGELVGLKLFQAYHEERGNLDKKDIIIIPKSAHGTNPATATMAGFHTQKTKDDQKGIVTIDADETGQINFEQLKTTVSRFGERIAGIMITNPNTSGVLELRFKEIADLIHSVDGLVYMDGANMNAIAGWIDLNAIGVDAVHNNLHKTWTVPHGGGGPGDAIVAVSEKLIPFLPGHQVIKEGGLFKLSKTQKSIGSFHRHYGNFAHKVRSYTYLKALGSEGIKEMSAIAVLSANYLFNKIKGVFPTLPEGSESSPRMHEFIITITKEEFQKLQDTGIPKAQAIAKIGKLFLDFGLHAPTVSFPEQFGLMIEPTESFSKKELDRFYEVLKAIHLIINEYPFVLKTTPHFTPVRKVDEVQANKELILSEKVQDFPIIHSEKTPPGALKEMEIDKIVQMIVKAAKEAQA